MVQPMRVLDQAGNAPAQLGDRVIRLDRVVRPELGADDAEEVAGGLGAHLELVHRPRPADDELAVG